MACNALSSEGESQFDWSETAKPNKMPKYKVKHYEVRARSVTSTKDLHTMAGHLNNGCELLVQALLQTQQTCSETNVRFVMFSH